MAYLLLIEQLERRVLADRQALIARGVSEQLPEFQVEQAALDARLVAEPTVTPAEHFSVEQIEKLEELRALGVA